MKSKNPEVHRLQGKSYELKAPGAGGWVPSDALGMELKADIPGKLSMRIAGDESTRENFPE